MLSMEGVNVDSVWMHNITGTILILSSDKDWGWILINEGGFYLVPDEFYSMYQKLGDL